MKVNKYVLTGLFVAVVFVLYAVFSGGNKKINSLAAPFEPQRIVASPADIRTKESRAQTVQQTVGWDRDPFLLPVFAMTEKKAEKERTPLKLLAIMESGRGRVAIIDTQVVGKGDLIAGERVAEVGKETVTLVQEGSRRVIKLQAPR